MKHLLRSVLQSLASVGTSTGTSVHPRSPKKSKTGVNWAERDAILPPLLPPPSSCPLSLVAGTRPSQFVDYHRSKQDDQQLDNEYGEDRCQPA